MEEQDRIEAKRAKNFIWSAAQCYDFEPLFLAFSLDGTADIYLNLIIGLCYKWYNREKMEAFFEMLNGKNQETLEGLFWIGLENAVYQKEKTSRSSLKELRKEYAQETVRHYRSQKEYSLIDRIRNGHCSQILGKSSGLKKEEQALLSEFDFSGKMTLEEMIEKSSEVFEHYFSYKPVLRKKQEFIFYRGFRLPFILLERLVQLMYGQKTMKIRMRQRVDMREVWNKKSIICFNFL